jgi:hypothetical protein
MEMRFFNTFAVVSLRVGQSEKTLLQKGTNLSIRTMFVFGDLRNGIAHSSSFQKAKPMFWNPCVSETPAIPSSPHLKVRDRA